MNIYMPTAPYYSTLRLLCHGTCSAKLTTPPVHSCRLVGQQTRGHSMMASSCDRTQHVHLSNCIKLHLLCGAFRTRVFGPRTHELQWPPSGTRGTEFGNGRSSTAIICRTLCTFAPGRFDWHRDVQSAPGLALHTRQLCRQALLSGCSIITSTTGATAGRWLLGGGGEPRSERCRDRAPPDGPA